MQDYNWTHGSWIFHLGLINIRLSFWAKNFLGQSLGHLGKDSLENLFSSSVVVMQVKKDGFVGKSEGDYFKIKINAGFFV